MAQDQIHFIGHSCVLATIEGQHFYVDLNLSQRILGLVRRRAALGIDVGNLPPPSALLVTHAHYDHLDLFSYKYFSVETPIICPRGLGRLINRFLPNPVIELKWGESHFLGKAEILALPTKHYGYRLSGLRYTGCNAYLVRGKENAVFHPGGTGYGPHFKEIGDQHAIDAAMLPIGGYRPRWMMRHNHMGPDEALLALADLKAKIMIPIHWGSFRLGLDGVLEPRERLNALLSHHPAKHQVKVLNAGEALSLNRLHVVKEPMKKVAPPSILC